MKDVWVALGRALRSLQRLGMLWHMLWPGLLAFFVWTVVAFLFWSPVIAGLMDVLSGWPVIGSWIQASGVAAAAVTIFVNVAVLLALVPLMYVSAALLVSAVAVPMMLERVAQREYLGLEQRQGGSSFGSLVNALWAGLLFVAVLVVSLPFWLIPGFGLIVSLLLTAWLNQRAFGYDALVLHADRDELKRLRHELRQPMYALGGGCALLAYVPLVNLLAPAVTALAFVHFMLISLERDRSRG